MLASQVPFEVPLALYHIEIGFVFQVGEPYDADRISSFNSLADSKAFNVIGL